MRMSVQFLVPRMQHHRRSRFEMLLVRDHIAKRLPRGMKQQIVDLPAISQSQRRQLIRQRKHHLEIGNAGNEQLCC